MTKFYHLHTENENHDFNRSEDNDEFILVIRIVSYMTENVLHCAHMWSTYDLNVYFILLNCKWSMVIAFFFHIKNKYNLNKHVNQVWK